MDKAVVGEKPNPAKNLPKADIKAAVFFDGTLNNRANTRVRQATQKELEEQVAQAAAEVEQARVAHLEVVTAQTQAEQAVEAANLAHVRAARGAERAAAAQTLRAAEGAAQPLRERRQQTDAELASAKRALSVAERTRNKYRDAIGGKSGANYYSNVSILQEMKLIEDETVEMSIYIEGIGTDDGEEDSSLGFGFGAGRPACRPRLARVFCNSKQK
jgi:chromosome segregation ATPase